MQEESSPFLIFNLETNHSASTHLKNLHISKKIPSQYQYQSAAAGSACLSAAQLPIKPGPAESTQQSPRLSRPQSADPA
ncbi:hypothetical protein Tco_0387307, partial [Tanacetum coccineum]